VQVLSISTPGRSFAYWLALNVPDLFNFEYQRVKRAALAQQIRAAPPLQGLGQDDDDEGDEDTDALDLSSDTDGVAATDAGILDTESPDQVLGITEVDTSSLDADMVALNSQALADVGSSLAASSGVPVSSGAAASMVAAVGNALTPAEVGALASAATAYFQTQSTSAMADVFAAQLANAAAGNQALPLTTVTAVSGASSPALIGSSGAATPLTPAQLAALSPSGLTVFLAQYGIWLGVGAAALLVLWLAAPKAQS
jgi:hypothetical protein